MPHELSLGWSFDYQYFNRAQWGTELTANPKNEQTMSRTAYFNASYQATQRLSLNAALPIRMINAPKDIRPNERVTRRFHGLGDLLVLANYQINVPEKTSRPAFAAQFGARLPTGKAQPDHTFSGSLSRDPVLQTGYGTVDPLLGVSCYQQLGKTGLSANVMTRLSGGQNKYGLKFSHEAQGGIGASRTLALPRALAKLFDGARLGLRVYGVKSGHDYDHGKMVFNTGGQWLYALPSLQVETKHGVSYFFQFQLPVYQNVNGGQLVAPYGFTTGFSFVPFRKREQAATESLTVTATPEVNVISHGERVELTAHLATGQVTVFEFYADWCGVCRSLDPKLKRRLAARAGITLKRINIGDGETAVSQQYSITTTPTFYVYDANGKLTQRFSTDNPAKVESVIAAAQAATTQP